MLPWAREEHHEENPMHPLLQAGTFGGDDDTRPSSFFVDGSDNSVLADGGNVDVKNAVKHPTGLAVDQVD